MDTVTPADEKRPEKTTRATFELEVVHRRFVTQHLVRLTLGGPGFAAFIDRPETDKYLKLRFADRGGHQVKRTYTVRSVDAFARTLDIDFVVHGDEGLAAPWAARAEAGDRVTATGPGGGYTPNPDADWHLFAGDTSALPAIAAALERLADARTSADATDAADLAASVKQGVQPPVSGAVFIEVESDNDIFDVFAPEGFEINWLVGPPETDTIADALREWNWPEGTPDIFVHGERASMKAVRKLLRDEREIDRSHISISGYWARGRNEDRFQAEKREPVGQIFPER